MYNYSYNIESNKIKKIKLIQLYWRLYKLKSYSKTNSDQFNKYIINIYTLPININYHDLLYSITENIICKYDKILIIS